MENEKKDKKDNVKDVTPEAELLIQNKQKQSNPTEEINSKTDVTNVASVTTTSSNESKDIKEASNVSTVEASVDQEKIEDNSDIFITEKDTFDIHISYYKNGDDLCVESVDEDFDSKNPAIKHFDVTFKYPSQGDYESIIAQNSYKTPDKMTLIDVMQMELTRLVVLMRRWSLNAEFTRMIELDPKIVKAMANKVREKIGVKGIL